MLTEASTSLSLRFPRTRCRRRARPRESTDRNRPAFRSQLFRIELAAAQGADLVLLPELMAVRYVFT